MDDNYEKILSQNLAANIRKYRAIQKLTQEQLAEAADLSQQYICMIENGKVSPSFFVVCKIADAFGISLDALKEKP